MKLIPAYWFLTITPPALSSGVGKSVSTLRALASPVSLTTAACDIGNGGDVKSLVPFEKMTRPIMTHHIIMCLSYRERKKEWLTLIVEGKEDMKRKEANAGDALATLAATRREARENMISK